MSPGHTLGPRQVLRAVLELLGHQRCAPEESEEEGHGHGQVDDVEDESVAAEELARFATTLGGRARGHEPVVVVGHGDSGHQQEEDEGDQCTGGEVGLRAMEPPDEVGHCTPPSTEMDVPMDPSWPM